MATHDDYPVIQAELVAGHPITGAYDVDDQIAADQLNALNREEIRASMTGPEIFDNTDPTELNALTGDQRREWYGFCGIDSHNPEVGGLAQQVVVGLFGGASVTATNLDTARRVPISRAKELGISGVIKIGDVQNARALP